MLRVIDVRHAGGYRLEVQFSDGHGGVVDLTDWLDGPVFEALRDIKLFALAALEPQTGTVRWPNDADIAPEYLLFRLASSEPELQPTFRRWGYCA